MFPHTSFKISLIFLTLISCRVFQPVFRYSLATRMLKIKLLLAGAFFAVPLFNYTGTRGLLDYLFLLRLMLIKPTRVTMVKPSWTTWQLTGPLKELFLLVSSYILGFDKIFPLISGLWPYRVLAEKDGPVHDVQWSSLGSEFAVVYGCILTFTVFLCNVEFWCNV